MILIRPHHIDTRPQGQSNIRMFVYSLFLVVELQVLMKVLYINRDISENGRPAHDPVFSENLLNKK